MTITTAGPDFLALQVRDLQRSADFYEAHLGMRRAPSSPQGAVVFATSPVPFAVRTPLPGTDLDAISPRPGAGVALWMRCDDVRGLHEQLVAAGTPVLSEPSEGPFGLMFAFADPDGYVVTVHDKA